MMLSLAACSGGGGSSGSDSSQSVSSFQYDANSFTLYTGLNIAEAPAVSGTFANCRIAPALPAGLTLDATTCTISGAPTAAQANTAYAIAADTADGTVSTVINIQIYAPKSGIFDSTFTLKGYSIASSQHMYSTPPEGIAIFSDNSVGVWQSDSSYIWASRFLTNGVQSYNASFYGVQCPQLTGTGCVIGATLTLRSGKIIGAYNSTYYSALQVFRINADGTLDTTFGGSGVATIADYASGGVVSRFVEQADGKILAVPTYSPGYMFRLNSDGTIDNTFGVNGFASASAGFASFSFSDIDVDNATGDIFALGTDSSHAVHIVRWDQNGTYQGHVSLGSSVKPYDVAFDAVTSRAYALVGNGSSNFSVVAYLHDLTLDTTFGSTGTAQVTVASGSQTYTPTRLAVEPGFARVLVLGNLQTAGDSVHAPVQNFDLHALNSDGSSSHSFNGSSDHLVSSNDNLTMTTILFAPDHSLYLSGTAGSWTSSSPGHWAVTTAQAIARIK